LETDVDKTLMLARQRAMLAGTRAHMAVQRAMRATLHCANAQDVTAQTAIVMAPALAAAGRRELAQQKVVWAAVARRHSHMSRRFANIATNPTLAYGRPPHQKSV
jgi:hypothetical protein